MDNMQFNTETWPGPEIYNRPIWDPDRVMRDRMMKEAHPMYRVTTSGDVERDPRYDERFYSVPWGYGGGTARYPRHRRVKILNISKRMMEELLKTHYNCDVRVEQDISVVLSRPDFPVVPEGEITPSIDLNILLGYDE